MRKPVLASVIGAVLTAGLAFAVPVSAAPTKSGAKVVFEQNGVITHQVCVSQDLIFAASGFAPGRRSVSVTFQLVGFGTLGSAPIPLSGGSGSINIGSLLNSDHDFVNTRIRVRFQTGSSSNTANRGSFYAEAIDC